MGRIRVRWHRADQGKIKTCRIVRKAGRWYVSLMSAVSEPMPLAKTGCIIGIDMDINALITTNDGQQVKNMVQNGHLSKRILDAGWGHFKQGLLDKAADAGREVVLVDPANTSKTCSDCGGLFEDLTLAHCWVEYECGLSLDRDHNADKCIRTGRTCP